MKRLEMCLKELGLNRYQALTYIALLRFGEQSGSQIARKVCVPSNKVYDSLEQLHDIGFVDKRMESPKRFRAVPAEICVKRLGDEQIQNLQEITNTAITRSQNLIKNYDDANCVWSHQKRETAKEKMKQAMKKAKSELVLLSSNKLGHKYRKTLENINDNVTIIERPIRGDADIVVVDRSYAMVLPKESGGIEIGSPSIATTLANLT